MLVSSWLVETTLLQCSLFNIRCLDVGHQTHYTTPYMVNALTTYLIYGFGNLQKERATQSPIVLPITGDIRWVDIHNSRKHWTQSSHLITSPADPLALRATLPSPRGKGGRARCKRAPTTEPDLFSVNGIACQSTG